MLSADELFSDGKLVPLKFSGPKTTTANTTTTEPRGSSEVLKSCRRLEMEISVFVFIVSVFVFIETMSSSIIYLLISSTPTRFLNTLHELATIQPNQSLLLHLHIPNLHPCQQIPNVKPHAVSTCFITRLRDNDRDPMTVNPSRINQRKILHMVFEIFRHEIQSYLIVLVHEF